MPRHHTIPRRTTGKKSAISIKREIQNSINDSGYSAYSQRILSDIPEHPYGVDYDPIAEAIASGRAVKSAEAVKEGFKNFCLQTPAPPANKTAKVFSMEVTDHKRFYLLNIPADKIPTVTKHIKELGGAVDKSLEKATNVIFYPTGKQMEEKTFFTCLTAAVSGRFLLPVSYILQSYDEKKFLNVFEYSKLEYINTKYECGETLLAAIKMSISYRKFYTKKRLPPYSGQKILFAVEKGQHEDVKLLLHFLGAVVQPYYSHLMADKIFNVCVTDGTVEIYNMPYEIPVVSPEDVREILWNSYKKFMS